MARAEVTMAMGLAVLMALSTLGAPVTAQEVAQDPKQPSVDNPHMHFWGTGDLSSCWTHFDGNDSSGSAVEGYGEKSTTSGQNAVDFTCRMQDNLKQDMYLDSNGTIFLEFTIEAYAPGNCDGVSAQCEELNVTLMKGTTEIATEQFNGISSGDPDTRTWQIPVNETFERWNKSSEEPSINFRWVGYADSGLQCIIALCDSYFRFFYSNNEDGHASEVTFPVVNATADTPMEDEDDGILGGVSDSLPGFGLLAGVGSLAMAAVAASRTSRED